MGGGRQAAAELRRERRERGGASTGEDSRGGRQGTIKASAAHLSRHRARGRESWCGSSSGSGTRADRPPAHTHARWQERVRRCPCPALGDREKGWSQVPSSHRGQPAEPPAVPRPGEPSARRRRRGGLQPSDTPDLSEAFCELRLSSCPTHCWAKGDRARCAAGGIPPCALATAGTTLWKCISPSLRSGTAGDVTPRLKTFGVGTAPSAFGHSGTSSTSQLPRTALCCSLTQAPVAQILAFYTSQSEL